jgi:hypothetical protein
VNYRNAARFDHALPDDGRDIQCSVEERAGVR